MENKQAKEILKEALEQVGFKRVLITDEIISCMEKYHQSQLREIREKLVKEVNIYDKGQDIKDHAIEIIDSYLK
jgi:hypothetical protein